MTNSRGGFVKTEEDAFNDTEALKLRSLGLTYREVALRLGVDHSTAFRRVQRALMAIPFDSVEEFRRLESERLDALFEVAYRKAISGESGFLLAIDRCIAIQERRARLCGLDAPSRAQYEISQWPTPEQLDEGVTRLGRIMEMFENGQLVEVETIAAMGSGTA